MFLFGGLWCIVVFSVIQVSLADKPGENVGLIDGKELSSQHSVADVDKLKITIFYESDCPDCVRFFRDQLGPNYKDFSQYIILDFVPYGNAKQRKDANGHYKFDCQHGQKECDENELQACAIDKFSKKSLSSLNDFIICYMASDDKNSTVKKCAKQTHIDLKKLKSCAKSQTGDILLARMGDRTHNFRPAVKWVPTIVFNDVGNADDSDRASNNLKKVMCEKLNNVPKACQ